MDVAPRTQPDPTDAKIDRARLGSIVRTLRERRRLRQKDLARLARVAPNTVQGLEAGRRTQPAQLERIAEALETTADALRRGEFQDAETMFRESVREAIEIAQLFIVSPTPIRSAVQTCLRTGAVTEFATMYARLDPDRQEALLVVLRALSEEQRAADAAEHEHTKRHGS